MSVVRAEANRWAREQFGDAALGDARRSVRLVKMLAGAVEKPSGRLSEVYCSKELDAAYDFVENDGVRVSRLETVVGEATARQCVRQRVRVAIDGSSLSLTPRRIGKEKGFGPVGSIRAGWLGLKVNTALAMSDDGTPIGVLAQAWWARAHTPSRTLRQCKRDRMRKKPGEKETARWLETIQRSADRLEAE